MKRFVWIYFLLVFFLISGLYLNVKYLNVTKIEELDLVEINRIHHFVSNNWDKNVDFVSKKFKYNYVVFDLKNNCLFQSNLEMPDTMQKCLKMGFPSVDIMKEKEIVGKIAIDPALFNQIVVLMKQNQKIINISFIMISSVLLLYFIYIKRTILNPFEKLDKFAKSVSSGMFDLSLPMDKKNIFGAFKESFDVMRESLKEARKNEQLANQSKKELIASLSHDMKTPITSVQLIIELLQAKYKGDNLLMDKLENIDIKMKQMNQLVSNMLQSTLEELKVLSINNSDVSSETLMNIFQDADFNHRIYYNDIPKCLVSCDVIRMEQVIGNIINNSYKYADTKIDISFAYVEEFLKISIRDYGQGVLMEELSYLCNKFYRGTNAKESKKSGEGLGLFISKSLIEGMNGSLECYSYEDGFLVCLFVLLSK